MSVLIGGSAEDAIALLPEGSETRTAELSSKLHDSRRAVRAQSLAVVASEVAVAVAEATLR